MSAEIDGDIKIYHKNSSSEISEFEYLIKSIDFNRLNGNEEKAEKLGVFLAGTKPTDEALDIKIPSKEMTSAVLYQSRVLITFLCEAVIKRSIPDSHLTDTIKNAMYDYLKESETGYYNNIADGAAFSFYIIAMNKGGDTKCAIGKEFAKLCGSVKNEVLASLGEKIFENTVNYVESLINKCSFQY